jgi:hypothetical protein
MKKLFALLLALCPFFAGAAANDIVLQQRNSTNTGDITRFMAFPPGAEGVFWLNATTITPSVMTLGSNMSVSSGVLDSVPPTWSTLASKPSFATVAFTGNYGDLSGAPTPSTPSQSAATRSLNSAFQVSTTRPALVVYSVQITVTASIAGGQNGDVILEIASDSGFTTNVQTLSASGVGQTYTLAIALQGVQPQTQPVTGFVPAGYYVRLRTVQNTGTPAFAYRFGQETLF